MSKKHFSWLLIVTAVITALVLLIPGKTSRESSFEKHAMVPGLAAVVNELDYLRLTGGGGEIIVTLERREGQWRVLEAASYPANWTRLKGLLSDLSRAEVIEEKTSNPEFYARLGVEAVSADGASGIMIEFAEQLALPALIVGNQASGREGQYLRLRDEKKSALIDRNLDVPKDRTQWLEQTIIDVAEGEVVEATIAHPDGEFLGVRKVSADDEDFQLLNVPDGREVKSVWSVNSMGGNLAALNLEQVVPDSEVDWSDAVIFSLLTADGLRMKVHLAAWEDAYWIRLQATAVQSGTDQAEQTDELQSAASHELAERVNQINSRVNGWAYGIPQHKFDTMTRRMTDMLKVEEAP